MSKILHDCIFLPLVNWLYAFFMILVNYIVHKSICCYLLNSIMFTDKGTIFNCIIALQIFYYVVLYCVVLKIT